MLAVLLLVVLPGSSVRPTTADGQASWGAAAVGQEHREFGDVEVDGKWFFSREKRNAQAIAAAAAALRAEVERYEPQLRKFEGT